MVKGSNLFWGCNYDVTMLQKCCVHVSYIVEMYNIKSCGEQCTMPNKAVMTLAHHFRNSYLQLGGVWYMTATKARTADVTIFHTLCQAFSITPLTSNQEVH